VRLSKAWVVATKDLFTFRTKRGVIYSTILFPFFVAVGFPLILRLEGARNGNIPVEALTGVMNAFSWWFIIAAAVLPTAIASYSLMGEKVEKSLEPLLATPTSDGEILLGKSIAAFVPPILAVYGCSVLFMGLMDEVTLSGFGFLYYPNLTIAVMLLLVAPLTSLLGVEVNVLISARVNDVRTANQYGGLLSLPFGAIYVASLLGVVSLDPGGLLALSGVLLLADVVLFFVSTRLFRREEIITKWR
jgi:ABC-type Na+ efflux pump permease subunit